MAGQCAINPADRFDQACAACRSARLRAIYPAPGHPERLPGEPVEVRLAAVLP